MQVLGFVVTLGQYPFLLYIGLLVLSFCFIAVEAFKKWMIQHLLNKEHRKLMRAVAAGEIPRHELQRYLESL